MKSVVIILFVVAFTCTTAFARGGGGRSGGTHSSGAHSSGSGSHSIKGYVIWPPENGHHEVYNLDLVEDV